MAGLAEKAKVFIKPKEVELFHAKGLAAAGKGRPSEKNLIGKNFKKMKFKEPKKPKQQPRR